MEQARWRNRGPSAEWILKVDVEVTQNDDSAGVESKPEGEVLVKSAMDEGCDPGRQWVLCSKDTVTWSSEELGLLKGGWISALEWQ